MFLDAFSYQCWCYECDEMFCPPLMVLLLNARESKEDAKTVSSLASSSATSRRKTPRASVMPLPAGVVGLYNLGNSCYMNAALQAFLNCPSITGFFLRCSAFIYRSPRRLSGINNNNHLHQPGHRISESCHRLVETIMNANMPVISPSRLVREVKMINPMFHGYTQQDTMDFLRCILERIHEEVPYVPCRSEHGITYEIPDFCLNGAGGSSPQKRRSERLAKQEVTRRNSITSIKGQGKESLRHRSVVSDTLADY